MIQVSILFRIFAAEWETSTSAEGALCTNLANGNVGNFHSNVQEGRTATALCVGLWTQFHIKGFSYDLHSELAKQSRASAVCSC